jgi:SAM-dependent methyltransferase
VLTSVGSPGALGSAAFDAALAGVPARLVRDDGGEIDLAVRRWQRGARGDDRWLLDRCTGPTVDLGCGPGRLVAALAARGVPALGVDVSAVAKLQCRRRGVPMARRDVFDPLPGEGTWQHVLLADGNIGIGGDPAALLSRCRELIGPAGRVLVELDPPGTGLRSDRVRLERGSQQGSWFDWAHVGADAVEEPAAEAGLRVEETWTRSGRSFAALVPPADAARDGFAAPVELAS